MKSYYVYILTNNQNSVLYIGVTNDLARRFYEHKHKLIDGFAKLYQVNKLVYYEEFLDSYNAISREKQLKNWHKDWKWNLVLKNNPSLKDLSENLFEDPETSSG